jgi:hypothetical protein
MILALSLSFYRARSVLMLSDASLDLATRERGRS